MPTIIKTFTSSQGGVKNYLSTRSSSFSGWTNVGTGATGSTTTTAAELPELSVGTALKVTNGGSGSGYVESDFFQVDASDLGKLLGLTYNLETSTSPAYAANNFQIQVWDATTSGGTYAQNTTLNVANIPSSPTGGTMQLSFSQNPSRPFTRIRIVRVAGLADSWASFSSITVTSATGGQSAAISEWQSLTLTPSSGWGTPANQVYYYKRDGSDAIFRGTFQAGTTSGNPATIGLPPGLSINAAAVPASARGCLGRFELASSAGTALISSTDKEGVLFYNGTNSDRLAFAIRSTTTGYETGNASSIAASSSYVMFEARVPIAEWAGSGTVNLGPGAQVEYAATSGTWDAASSTTVYGPGGAALGGALTASRTKTVTFQYPIQADDQVFLEFSTDGTRWAPHPSASLNSVPVPTLANFTAFAGGIGARVNITGATTCDVVFGRYQTTRFDDGSNQADWPSSNAFWRVRKAKASAPVGFGLAKASESGLVAPRRGQQALTVTSSLSGWATTRAVGIYYQDQDGNHRFKFNIAGTVSSGTYTGGTWTITGVTFKNTTNFRQAVSIGGNNLTGGVAFTLVNTSDISVAHPSTASMTGYYLSGDVELESRPTWA